MFTPSNMLLKYLNAQPRDMYDIIGALMGYINADPYFQKSDFDEAVQYVLSNGVTRAQLFVPFDEDLDFEEDSCKWDNEYYSFARVYLKDNFCEKRIQHVKNVARKLRPVSPAAPVRVSAAPQGGQQTAGKKYQDQHHQKSATITPQAVIIGIAVIVLLVMLVALIVFI